MGPGEADVHEEGRLFIPLFDKMNRPVHGPG